MQRGFLSEPEEIACDREIRARVGHALRAAYEPIVSQSLPERLARLVHRLENREGEEARDPIRRGNLASIESSGERR